MQVSRLASAPAAAAAAAVAAAVSAPSSGARSRERPAPCGGLVCRSFPEELPPGRGRLPQVVSIRPLIVGCETRSWAKKDGPEPGFDTLSAALLALPDGERRAALSCVGLAVGDAVGLPFELGAGIEARAQFHALTDRSERLQLAKTLALKRCLKEGHTPFVRTYSDDTTCCDLKMEAVAQADKFLEACSEGADAGQILQQAVLQQYLKWAHGAKTNHGKGAHGGLFRGTGGFTQDFLVPYCRRRYNEVARAFEDRPLFRDHAEFGPFWPTTDFTDFATAYFRGEHSFPSWGNGAVMSFAPHPILAGRWRSSATAASPQLVAAAQILSRSHQEPTALLASEFLWEILDLVYAGSVRSTQDLRAAVRYLHSLEELTSLDHECIPVAAFREWLEEGDCRPSTAEGFLRKLTGSEYAFDFSSAPYGAFGALLHAAADWDNDHGVTLRRRSSSEPVLFSQRGLNSVLIAIWSASEAQSPWEVFDRVIYVGGDTDTVGAVAGQVACPLLQPAEVVQLFVDIVALGRPRAGPLQVVDAAARRYFGRSLLFAAGDLEGLRGNRSLLDPGYDGITGGASESRLPV